MGQSGSSQAARDEHMNTQARISETMDLLMALGQRMEQRFTAFEQRMDQGLAALEQCMNQGFAALDQRFTALEQVYYGRFAYDQALDDLDRNAAVMYIHPIFLISTPKNRIAEGCAMKRCVIHADTKRVPLHSFITGLEIKNFPETIDQVGELPVYRVDQLLRHLGQSLEGTADEKRRTLRFVMGIVR
ncbi:hypothetical protein E4U55_008000 [Claviceps digitariae]|nr:hypothetical protein E4U55_008000 [Claviceps digitariae]